MKPPDESASENLENRALWLLLVYGTILWGSIVALLFVPLYRRLLPRLNQRRTPAALLTLLIALVIVILPFAIVTASVAREASLTAASRYSASTA